ncbi:metal-dependent hydrolase [Acidisoma silvae]|uniref:Metal-dependent hydrolase n=1 Tax=Acidisoma silvae TaxID=2802396 RepID=A0A964E196_9PROT|nr:metal-dependent hydrolase [Acidisoma silvae]MCB8878116.1 metal-dependent hydrolase [Acidisoma silvae]
MMARSHALIGGTAAVALGACGIVPLTPIMLIAAVVGSLAPDIDHPHSKLGRMFFFVSYPLNAIVGHRTATHSILALALCAAMMPFAERAGFSKIGFGFLVGYTSHILADLLTKGGCALLYPVSRVRYGCWPAIKTGSKSEALLLVPILGLIVGIAYHINPTFFRTTDVLRGLFEAGVF